MVELERSGRIHYPKSMDIRKLEVDIAVPEVFRTINYIRQKTLSGESAQYQIQSLWKTPSEELLSISGLAKKEGCLEATNLKSDLSLKGKKKY